MAEEFKQLLNLLNSEDNSVRQSAEDKYASLGKFKKFFTRRSRNPWTRTQKTGADFFEF